jgi:hypothetical protein
MRDSGFLFTDGLVTSSPRVPFCQYVREKLYKPASLPENSCVFYRYVVAVPQNITYTSRKKPPHNQYIFFSI